MENIIQQKNPITVGPLPNIKMLPEYLKQSVTYEKKICTQYAKDALDLLPVR